MKTLLHVCCAPCSIKCIESLITESINPVLFWYNPNIHPYTEYMARLNSLKQFASENKLELIIKDEYGLQSFIHKIYPNLDNRCSQCYEMRLSITAQFASENGYDNFTSTLFISPYQNHEMLSNVSKVVAQRYDIPFLYKDFRPNFRQGQRIARENNLYIQKYCGCIFSEEERYKPEQKN